MWGNSMQNDDMHSAGSCMASGQPPDDALILRIAQGDTAALEVLYRQTSSSIYGFALSILRDPVAAEDVMQDTFVSVMQSAPGYQPSGKPMAWLLTIARNLALMRLRRAESKNLSFDELFHVEDTHDAYQTTENHMVLEKVLQALIWAAVGTVILPSVLVMFLSFAETYLKVEFKNDLPRTSQTIESFGLEEGRIEIIVPNS